MDYMNNNDSSLFLRINTMKLLFSSFVVGLFIILSFISSSVAKEAGQVRVAVLPFENADGRMEYNIWCYNIQDSLAKFLKSKDPEEFNYRIVPIDSIETLLADMNIDPANPQYASDLWKVVEKLNCQKVISGNFNIQDGKFLLNAYIYIPELKLPDPRYQVKNIFKDLDKIYEVVPIIGKKLRPAILD